MPKVVIANGEPMEIGVVRTGLRRGPYGMGSLPSQRYKVIAESTAAEWVEAVVAFGGPRDEAEMFVRMGDPWFYYEIQTD